MQLGNLLAVPVALVVALLFKKWRLSIGIALIGLCKLYATGVVKDLVVRHRPAAVLGQVHARDDTGLGQAFVSGHVVVVVALATLAHPYVSPRLRILFWSLAGIVAFGRVYVGAHLPLDVVGGAALGCAMACAIHVVLGPPKPEDAAVTSSE
jgi:undecaprenyl-diphosphatase